jgi:ubiquinone biosynthesis protein UbiJ
MCRDVPLYLIPEPNKLSVYGRFEAEPDTVLRGTPLALMRMGLVKHAGDVLFAGDVEIRGDVELGQEFSEILEALDIDWEEHLSHVTGDLVAHKLGNAVRGMMSWGKQTTDTLSQDVTEYLQEESDTLPNADEVEDFLQQVDVLRTDVDRMAARVRRLESASKKDKQTDHPADKGDAQ